MKKTKTYKASCRDCGARYLLSLNQLNCPICASANVTVAS